MSLDRPCRTLCSLIAVAACLLCLAAHTAHSLDADVSFTETAELVSGGTNSFDEFGHAVDLDGDTMIVGAWFDDPNGSSSGSAAVFQRDGSGEWTEVAELSAPDGQPGDNFGSAVAISGDWAIVGARGGYDGRGVAYVFARDIGGPDAWGFFTELRPSDSQTGEAFGDAAALSGDTAIIGAPERDGLTGDGSGAAYIFQRDAGGPSNWGEVAILTAPDPESGDHLGSAVGISGSWALAGAPGDADAGQTAGAGYLFERNAGGADNWGFVTKLLASDGSDGDGLGTAVDVSGETLVVGAEDADSPHDQQGAAYVYERDAGGPDNWGEVAKLTAIDGAAFDGFGAAVAIRDETIAVGVKLDDDLGQSSGSAYLFRRDEGGPDNWGKIAKLITSDGEGGDRFGAAVAVDGSTLAASAEADDERGSNSGSVYLFDEILVDPALVVTGNCPGDVTFNFTGATPLGQAALTYSQEIGDSVIPSGICAGTESDLAVINLLGILPTDAAGEISLDVSLPFFVCDLQLQAVDLVSCATSNVTTLP